MTSSRDAMETLAPGDPDVKIKALDGRSDPIRKELEKKVKDTNQNGLFQKLGDQFFETTFNHKNQMCNFPVTLVKYEGKVPANGSETEKSVPALTYMVFEPQIKWNKKWLTYNYSEPEKRKGVVVASMPDSYTNTEYFNCLPNIVAQSTQYREMYVKTNKGNYSRLTINDLKEEFTVFK